MANDFAKKLRLWMLRRRHARATVALHKGRVAALSCVLLAAMAQGCTLNHGGKPVTGVIHSDDASWKEGGTTDLPLRWRVANVSPPNPGDSTPLRIYLGGDGQPWRTREPATRPDSPRSLALALFARDPDAGVYLGRPCYHMVQMPAACDPKWWTSHRYSPEVVDSLEVALRELQGLYPGRALELVGYSGGATLALLLSARLPAIERVLTVAPNLDTAAWTAFHGVLPLVGSLNPATIDVDPGARVDHFFGERDEVVPPQLARDYLQRHPQHGVHVLPGFGHQCCWLQHWPALLHRVWVPTSASN